ncbi:MAG: recombination mediator RecR [Cytophagaceae bacterium]|nr:recombination mediator RecR [Cytophagaceae bacterium]MDW8457149.1 recombination mediator RecR [Cytophagaceae bacterium]
MTYPSRLIEEAVNEISKLPGIGKKSALRLVLHLLKEDADVTHLLCRSLTDLRTNIRYCVICHNISDGEVCNICSGTHRDHSLVCVVEDIRDVMAIENTQQYNGLYHILGGAISPVQRIGPSDLNIESLCTRIQNHNEIKEIILALSTTMEGDTTAFYITKKIKEAFPHILISSIARGVPLGGELEYADEITLGRSIVTRAPYNV